VVAGLASAGAADIPVVVGGIIPPEDAVALRRQGVVGVFTPKDYDMTSMMNEIVDIVLRANA
jgi:(2R)-ethylmalonyl-CoA mutase